MLVLAYCLLRNQRSCPLIRTLVTKRSFINQGWKKVLPSSELPCCDKHLIFGVHKRTFMKKRELIGESDSFYLKSEHKNDKVGKEFNFVYCSSNVKFFIWWTPLALLVIGAILVMSVKLIVDDLRDVLPQHEHKLWNYEMDVLGLAYVIIPVALCFLVILLYLIRVTLLRLYYNPSTNEFIAIVLRYGVYREKLHFKPSDIINLETAQLRGNVLVKGLPLRVSESSFKDVAVYNIFMGYNISRPSDYKKQLQHEDITKILEKMEALQEKKQIDEFLEKDKEKRKLKQIKKH